MDYSALYDGHPEYDARRKADSYEAARVALEVAHFKAPGLCAVWPGPPPRRLLEIGCATGELLAALPVAPGGERVGVDISARNIEAARERFPHCRFEAGDFRALGLGGFDAVVLSDVLEHVPDDAAFLADAARCAQRAWINLPLECNWLNRNRRYGPDDVSGHLRAYTLQQGLALIARAGLKPLAWQTHWMHEGEADRATRALRAQHHGQAFEGGALTRPAKAAVWALARGWPAFGRRLLPGNLFALAGPAPAAAS